LKYLKKKGKIMKSGNFEKKLKVMKIENFEKKKQISEKWSHHVRGRLHFSI